MPHARRWKSGSWGVTPLQFALAMVLGVLIGLAILQFGPSGSPLFDGPSADGGSAPDLPAPFDRERDEEEAAGRNPPRARTVSPREFRIVDGDTFWVGREKIRVADIDTPEVQGQCDHERDLAAKATDRMEELLRKGPFQLHPLPNGRDEDRYGRKLRIVTRGGRSLGDQLVAEGLARTWSGRREPWC